MRKTSAIRTNRQDIQNKKNEATVYVYGDIGGWFGIDHEEFVKNIVALDADVIHLRIDSSGGDVFAARAMKTAIMQHKAKVIAHVDGLAASAASFLAMGADEIEIVDGGFLMIHNALSGLDILGYFNIDDLTRIIDDVTKERDLHVKINESIANDYMKRTGATQEQVSAWMSGETWFTAKEALENKFVDRVYEGEPVEGSYNLSVFAKVPDEVTARNTNVSKRALEKALRDAGISNKDAKKILAEGFKEDLRDEDVPPQRDVASTPKKDRVADLLTRAEII